MAWQQLRLQVQSGNIDFLEQQLLEQGAVSVTYLDAKDQPVFQKEPGSTPLWDESILLSLFEADADLHDLLEWLQQNPAILNRHTLKIDILEDQAWERACMDDFHAMQFGERLWICPSWQEPPNPSAVNIILDPGLAFGSGSHPTTGMCLTWLDGMDLQEKLVIDYGCGSGILALASALLGAARVIGVDNDPQALVATRDNAERNHIAEQDLLTFLPEAVPALQADILLANILAEPLIELASHFATLVKPGGQLVLSGLLSEQASAVLSAYTPWFEMQAPFEQQQWVRLSGRRKS
jgi:ribosomal protein L11 methyltransferase